MRSQIPNNKPPIPSMNRSDLISRLAELHPQLKLSDAELSVRVILEEISETLSKNDRVEIRGFGGFGLNYRPPRKGRNPKTADKVSVPAKYVPHFKVGKDMRERVDCK
jgi:integration host factor subunit beta